MNWLIFSLLVAFLSAALNLLVRVLVVKSENPRAFSLVFNIWAASFAAMIYILQPKQNIIIPSLVIIMLIVLSSSLYGLFERFQFYARKEIDASNTTILFRSSAIITFVGSILIFNESLTLEKALGFGLVVLATVIVSINNTKLKINKAFTLAIVSALALGSARIIDKGVLSSDFSIELYNLILWVAPILFIFLPSIPMDDIKKEMNIGTWKIPLLAAINVCILYFLLHALSLADASLVIPIVSASTILTVLGGVIILKERSNLPRKIIAGFIVFVGILLLR